MYKKQRVQGRGLVCPDVRILTPGQFGGTWRPRRNFLGSFLEALGDFWVPFGYQFDVFWRSVGAVKMVLPLRRELNFEVCGGCFFGFFPGWFCSGVWNRFFEVFLRFWGPLGMPLGSLWEHLAALLASRFGGRFLMPKWSILGHKAEREKGTIGTCLASRA